MATFSYNIFKNPNNDGLYYTDHSHDLNTGMTIANNTNVTHFRSPNTVHPHLHRKWLIDESNSTNNGPIFRKHVGSSLFINSTTSNQPYTRTFDYVPTISDIEEVGGSAQTNSSGDRQVTIGGGDRVAEDETTYSGQSAALAQAVASQTLDTDSTAGKINPKNIVDGMNTYLDLDQSVEIDSFGAKRMSLVPLMTQGTGSISGTANQFESVSIRLRSLGIKETSLVSTSGNVRNYFPVRGRVINGYDKGGTNPAFPNKTNSENYARQRVSLMNFNIQRRTHSSYLH